MIALLERESTQAGNILDQRYRLVRPLGGGGAATVWLAADLEGDEQVALKLLHPKYRSTVGGLDILAKEAEALGVLSHPSIARARAVVLDRSQPFIVLELVEGGTLAAELGMRSHRGQPFPLETIRRMFAELCGAVDHAHASGVIHRDLKPQNIMLLPAGGATLLKVLDFGIARLLFRSAHLATTEGRIAGSVPYMPPEQSAGLPAGPSIDIFALGTLLFECLTLHRCWLRSSEEGFVPAFSGGQPLHDQNHPLAIMTRISSGPRPKPSLLRPELSSAVDEVVARALMPKESDRYPRASVLYRDLEGALASVIDDAGSRTQPTSRPEPSGLWLSTEVREVTRLVPASTDAEPVDQDLAPMEPISTLSRAPTVPVGASAGLTNRPRRLPTWASSAAVFILGALGSAVTYRLMATTERPPTTGVVVIDVPRLDPVAPSVVQSHPPSPAEPVGEPRPKVAVERASHVGRAPDRKAASPSLAKNDLLRRFLSAAEDSGSPEALRALREQVVRAANELPEGEARRRITRLAMTAAHTGDLATFELAIAELEKTRP